jgi:hypothetical protein
MLARDADAGFDTIEKIEIFEVSEQDLVNFTDPRWQQVGSGFQEMLDLTEQPGTPLRRTADHHRVGMGDVENLRAFSGEPMSPLAMTGMRPGP